MNKTLGEVEKISLGQINYDAWCRASHSMTGGGPYWRDLSEPEQAFWQAAAEAVVKAHEAGKKPFLSAGWPKTENGEYLYIGMDVLDDGDPFKVVDIAIGDTEVTIDNGTGRRYVLITNDTENNEVSLTTPHKREQTAAQEAEGNPGLSTCPMCGGPAASTYTRETSPAGNVSTVETLKAIAASEMDLTKCPRCGGEADNGISREVPPSVYLCSKCQG